MIRWARTLDTNHAHTPQFSQSLCSQLLHSIFSLVPRRPSKLQDLTGSKDGFGFLLHLARARNFLKFHVANVWYDAAAQSVSYLRVSLLSFRNFFSRQEHANALDSPQICNSIEKCSMVLVELLRPRLTLSAPCGSGFRATSCAWYLTTNLALVFLFRYSETQVELQNQNKSWATHKIVNLIAFTTTTLTIPSLI